MRVPVLHEFEYFLQKVLVQNVVLDMVCMVFYTETQELDYVRQQRRFGRRGWCLLMLEDSIGQHVH